MHPLPPGIDAGAIEATSDGLPRVGGTRGLLRRLAGAVAATHFVVSMYILFGGLLVLAGVVPMWWHIPIAAWGVWVHLVNWTCPLTPLEKWLRVRSGEATYHEGFVERYLLPGRFRGRMTNARHRLVGLGVLAVNLAIYSVIVFRHG